MQNRLSYLPFASTTLVFWLTFSFLPFISNYQPIVAQASTVAEQEPGAEKWFLEVYELWLKGEYPATLAKLQQYLTDFREKGDRAREGAVIACIAIVYRSMGNYNQSLRYFQEALAILRANSLKNNSTARIWEGRALDQMGLVYSFLGQYPQAFASAQQALDINRKMGDLIWEGRTLNNLANLYSTFGQDIQALELYQKALVIHQKIGNEPEVAVTLANIGTI
ncbi:MAG TPA: tetratricopeptide repeat protein, partial [Phormidium sp.]